MWITKLQLSNIKSYGPDSPPILFRPGVNLIQGKNGAGKSTILEAIGLALFDSKAYNLGQFVREGARSGTVTVGFISARDDREYEVVRSVGGSSQMYAYDPDTKRKICEGKEDTTIFIRQHLNVEPETDLKTLFEDAVGVPQGTMTAIFRESASVRKEKFNRLLGIDSYERVWQNLRQTGSYIKSLIDQNAQQQAELRGILSEKPSVETQAAELTNAISESRQQLENVTAELESVREALLEIEGVRAQLDDLNHQVRESDTEVRQLMVRQEQAANALEEAEQAAVVVAETEPAEQSYRAAQQDLVALEEARQARDRLRQILSDLETGRQVGAQRVETIQQGLEDVTQAEAELTVLEPLLERQMALEEAIQQAQSADQRYVDLRGQIDRQREMLTKLRARFEQLQADLPESDTTHPAAPVDIQDGDLDNTVMLLRDTINGLESALSGWQGADTRMQEAEVEQSTLAEQLDARQRITEQLGGVENALQTQTEHVNDLRLSIGSAQQDLTKLDDHRALLGEPGAVCPVCRQTVDAHAQEAAQAHFVREQQRLQTLLISVNNDLAQANNVLEELNTQRRGLSAELAQLPGDSVLASVVARRETAQTEANELLGELQTLSAGAGVLLALADEQIALADNQLQALVDQVKGLVDLRVELAELDNPRRRYDLARVQAARRSEWERQLKEAEAALTTVHTQVDEVQAKLQAYSGLEEDLLRLRSVVSENEKAHQRYLSNVDKAATLEARQGALDRIAEDLAAQLDAQSQLGAQRDALAEGYDAAHHEALQVTRRKFEDEQLTITTRLGEWDTQFNAYQDRLREFAEQEDALAVAVSEAGRLQARMAAFEFVRQAIRDAGPQITQQLVRLISEQANHIFGDILGDHSFILNWSEDYGITINSRGDERDFELLSGGEQMVAAMSVRLALLTQLATVRFAFFDEPTTNLDDSRRAQLAERLSEIHSLQQLFVISHDDTFEQESYHVIQVYKDNGFSQVEML